MLEICGTLRTTGLAVRGSTLIACRSQSVVALYEQDVRQTRALGRADAAMCRRLTLLFVHQRKQDHPDNEENPD